MDKMLSCVIALMIGQPVRYDAAFSERLLKWRVQFEQELEEPKRSTDYGYIHLYSETLGPAHSIAFYPLGSASERFVLSFHVDVGYIFFESRHGKKVLVDWAVPFVKTKHKRAVKGTIPKYLMSEGFAIAPKGRLSSDIRKRLERSDYYASFFFHSMEGGFASMIKPDGSTLKTHKSNDMFSILPEELSLLRKRAKRR